MKHINHVKVVRASVPSRAMANQMEIKDLSWSQQLEMNCLKIVLGSLTKKKSQNRLKTEIRFKARTVVLMDINLMVNKA